MLSLLPLLSLLLAPALGHLPFEFGDGVDTLLSAPLDTSFSCEGRPYGYYADTANNCQVFHVCLPIPEEDGLFRAAHFSFACGNRTVFSQDSLTCSHPEDAYPCEQSEALYDLVNAEFGRVLPDGERARALVIPEPATAPAAAIAPAAAPVAAAAPEAAAAEDADAAASVDTAINVEKSLDSDYPLYVEETEDYETPVDAPGYLPL